MRWLEPIGAAGGTPGDQARASYARLPDDTLHVTEYVAASALDHHPQVVTARIERLGHNLPVTTVVVAGFPSAATQVLLLEATVGPNDAGVVWLPEISGVNPGSEPSTDLGEQIDAAFAEASRRLAVHGLGLDAAVLTVDQSMPGTRRDYRHTGRVRKRWLGPVYPGAAGILQERLLDPAALVSLDVVASRHPLRAVNPGWGRYDKLTYSPGVEAGPLLFMAGYCALDPVTEIALFPGDVVAQAEYAYSNILAVLAAAGLGPDALVRLVEYVTPAGAARLGETDAVRDRLLGGYRPPITRVSCAALLRPEFQIEVIPLARRL